MNWVTRGLVSFLLLASAASPGFAQSFPKPNNTRVVDAANLLPPAEESALDQKLADFEKATGRQFVVATIPDLQGYPIEDFGYRLGRAWGVGSKDKDDGALLIVAPKDRKVRIEVGYGLEPYLTDALSSVIINTQILPLFKAGDYPGGITAGADAVMAQLQLPPEEAAARVKAADAPAEHKGGIPIALIFWAAILIFFVLPSFFGRRRGRRHRGIAPVMIWGPGDWGGSRGGGFGGGFGGFSGGGGSFGGGGASGSW